MPEITSPRKLFLHELGDILYVEQKLANEVPQKLIGEVEDSELQHTMAVHVAVVAASAALVLVMLGIHLTS